MRHIYKIFLLMCFAYVLIVLQTSPGSALDADKQILSKEWFPKYDSELGNIQRLMSANGPGWFMCSISPCATGGCDPATGLAAGLRDQADDLARMVSALERLEKAFLEHQQNILAQSSMTGERKAEMLDMFFWQDALQGTGKSIMDGISFWELIKTHGCKKEQYAGRIKKELRKFIDHLASHVDVLSKTKKRVDKVIKRSPGKYEKFSQEIYTNYRNAQKTYKDFKKIYAGIKGVEDVCSAWKSAGSRVSIGKIAFRAVDYIYKYQRAQLDARFDAMVKDALAEESSLASIAEQLALVRARMRKANALVPLVRRAAKIVRNCTKALHCGNEPIKTVARVPDFPTAAKSLEFLTPRIKSRNRRLAALAKGLGQDLATPTLSLSYSIGPRDGSSALLGKTVDLKYRLPYCLPVDTILRVSRNGKPFGSKKIGSRPTGIFRFNAPRTGQYEFTPYSPKFDRDYPSIPGSLIVLKLVKPDLRR